MPHMWTPEHTQVPQKARCRQGRVREGPLPTQECKGRQQAKTEAGTLHWEEGWVWQGAEHHQRGEEAASQDTEFSLQLTSLQPMATLKAASQKQSEEAREGRRGSLA